MRKVFCEIQVVFVFYAFFSSIKTHANTFNWFHKAQDNKRKKDFPLAKKEKKDFFPFPLQKKGGEPSAFFSVPKEGKPTKKKRRTSQKPTKKQKIQKESLLFLKKRGSSPFKTFCFPIEKVVEKSFYVPFFFAWINKQKRKEKERVWYLTNSQTGVLRRRRKGKDNLNPIGIYLTNKVKKLKGSIWCGNHFSFLFSINNLEQVENRGDLLY